MEKENIELAITISSIILFLSSEVLGKSQCEYNSIMDLIIGIASRCKKNTNIDDIQEI
jgi:hypothetical protein